jgi:hypothetical protein
MHPTEQHDSIKDGFKGPVGIRVADFARGNLSNGGLGYFSNDRKEYGFVETVTATATPATLSRDSLWTNETVKSIHESRHRVEAALGIRVRPPFVGSKICRAQYVYIG